MPILYLIASCLIGMAFAVQPAINAVAAKSLGSPIPATVLSVGITLAASAVIMMFGRTTPSWDMLTNIPIWVGFGGLIGVLVVAGGATIVPVTGAAIFFVCLVAGQLVGSVLLDQFGAFGLAVKEISLYRLIGLGLTFAGVLFVRYG